MQKLAGGYGLCEAPVFDSARGLYFSDVLNGGIHLLDAKGEVTLVVPKRRGVGGMALHEAGGLVVCGRDISFIPLGGAKPKTWLSTADVPGSTGFNDLTTDKKGRIYVGSLAFRVFGGEEPKPGFLHVIDLDGRMRVISDGIMLTNGLGFSPDGGKLYHSDARAGLVRVYDVVAADGTVGPWRSFAKLGDGGVPDGLKVASDGSVWVADARGGRVAVFNPDGSHRRDIAVPLPMVTSLSFGGADLRDLYIVTGSTGGPSQNCGSIFRMRADVAGLSLPPARVSIT